MYNENKKNVSKTLCIDSILYFCVDKVVIVSTGIAHTTQLCCTIKIAKLDQNNAQGFCSCAIFLGAFFYALLACFAIQVIEIPTKLYFVCFCFIHCALVCELHF